MGSTPDQDTRAARYDAIYAKAPEPGVFGRELLRENLRLLKFLIPEGQSVLDLGCGTGDFLDALKPSRGVGVDLSTEAVRIAAGRYPGHEFHAADAGSMEGVVEGTFDVILLNFAVGDIHDLWQVFRNARRHCRPDTRVVITHYNFLWEPFIKLGSALGARRRWPEQNWFSLEDIATLLELNGFEIVQNGTRMLCPVPLPPLSQLANRLLAGLPLIRHLNLMLYSVARLKEGELTRPAENPTVSFIIPTRNEKGNIRDAVTRTPVVGAKSELIFVDGASTDGTVEEIEACIAEFGGTRPIRLIHQVAPGAAVEGGKMLKLGKGDAVRKGFAAAEGDVLVILDSDLTVPPEEMPKFYLAIAENRAEFINGNRLSYPMEDQAMRFLNLVANRIFGMLFTWLLGQRVKDTLCGTKVLRKSDYLRIADNRACFGDFDPFGDFDLLFGAAKLNLKIMDLPVRYRARTYGEIKIERFKHGLLLLRMCFFAFRRFKM